MSRSRRAVKAIPDFDLLSNGRHQFLPQRMLNLTNQVIFGGLNEDEAKLQCSYTHPLSNRVIGISPPQAESFALRSPLILDEPLLGLSVDAMDETHSVWLEN